MDMNYQINDRILTIYLKGELDHHAARKVMDNTDHWIEQHLPVKIILDMSGLTFMDSSGIAVVIRAKRRAELAGGNLTVVNIPGQAVRVLETAGLGRYIEFK